MIVYYLFVHKKIGLKEKSLYYFHKNFFFLNQKKNKKKTFLVGFLGGFFVFFCVGFFGWVF
jgi:hypothetical protein